MPNITIPIPTFEDVQWTLSKDIYRARLLGLMLVVEQVEGEARFGEPATYYTWSIGAALRMWDAAVNLADNLQGNTAEEEDPADAQRAKSAAYDAAVSLVTRLLTDLR